MHANPLCRLASSALLWLAAAVLTIGLAAAYWPRAEARKDAASPARRFTAAQLGPSAKEAIEAMGRRGYPSPDDVIDR